MANWIPKIVYNTSVEVVFEYPPKGKDPKDEQIKFNGVVSTSKSGIEQTIEDYTEILNSVKLSHISDAIWSDFYTFITTWGYKGKEFDYYFDKDDVATKVTVTIPKNGRNVKPKIIAWDLSVNPRTPIRSFELKLRRVI